MDANPTSANAVSATWRDLRDLFLIPGMASLLPRRLAARWVAHWIAHSDAYGDEARNAQHGIDTARWVLATNAQQFSKTLRALLAHAYADRYRLARNENAAAPFDKNSVHWPDAQAPVMMISLHWGAALFPLREFVRRYGPVRFVSASLNKSEFTQFPWRYRYAKSAIRTIESICHAPVIFTGGARNEIINTLDSGGNVAVLIDVPPHQVGGTTQVKIAERNFALPNGTAQIAYETGAHVIITLSHPNVNGDDHFFSLCDCGVMPTPTALHTHTATMLAAALAQEPAAWTMWAHLPDFLRSDSAKSF